MSIGSQPEELEQLRQRLRKMSDNELRKFGRAATFMYKEKGPRETFVTQLNEARAEWRRRHPKA
jgi:hypothetical protein